MANPPPALPDFEVIARSHAGLSRELSRCENLPTLQGGNLILQELRAFREQMGGVRVREQIGGVQGQIGQIKTLITTTNNNNIARPHNSQMSRIDQPLMPLRSVLTNELIPLFPETVHDLQRLSNAVTVDILRALGASTDENAAMRKVRLRLHCGLKQEPI